MVNCATWFFKENHVSKQRLDMLEHVKPLFYMEAVMGKGFGRKAVKIKMRVGFVLRSTQEGRDMNTLVEHDGFPFPKDTRVWLDETQEGGICLYLAVAEINPEIIKSRKDGFWLQLENVGLIRFEFVAFIKGEWIFVARQAHPGISGLSAPCLSPENVWRGFAELMPGQNEVLKEVSASLLRG